MEGNPTTLVSNFVARHGVENPCAVSDSPRRLTKTCATDAPVSRLTSSETLISFGNGFSKKLGELVSWITKYCATGDVGLLSCARESGVVIGQPISSGLMCCASRKADTLALSRFVGEPTSASSGAGSAGSGSPIRAHFRTGASKQRACSLGLPRKWSLSTSKPHALAASATPPLPMASEATARTEKMAVAAGRLDLNVVEILACSEERTHIASPSPRVRLFG